MPDGGEGAVVLAAGRSTRLGHPKQLVCFRGEPLVRRAARAALEAGLSPVIVVIAPGAGGIRAALAGLPVDVVENAAAAAGVGTSVAAGVARLREISPAASGVVLLACDQPLVGGDHLRAMLQTRQTAGKPVVASEYGGVRGVPVLLAAEILGELAVLDGDSGAREVVRRDPARVAGVPFPGGALDVDRAADVAAARELERDGE